MKAQHSAKTPRWGTPQHIIELARELMGGIHMDPASSEEFNCYVKALMIYTQAHNGLAPECEWYGNLFCNPPGGLVREFWRKLCDSYWANKVEKAFWVGFSVEQLCSLADEKYHPMDFNFCVLRKRLNFNQQSTVPTGRTEKITIYDSYGMPAEGEIFHPDGGSVEEIKSGHAPTHGNYVCAMGVDPLEFQRLFSPHGRVVLGKYSLDTKRITL